MNPSAICAICGHELSMDCDHVEATVEKVRMKDRNSENTFYIHKTCWNHSAGNWRGRDRGDDE